jgi:hypothetical protein
LEVIKNRIIKNKKNQLNVKKKKNWKKLRTKALIQFTKLQEYSSCNFFDFFHGKERKMQP